MKKLDKVLLNENIEKIMAEDLYECNVGGASLIVNQSGKTVFKKHFGTVSPENTEAVSDSTLFRLASMTKPITSVAAMMLLEKGLLSLDDTVESFLPQFKDMYVEKVENGVITERIPAKTKLTVKHLLSHTSGIGSGVTGAYYAPKMTKEILSTLDGSVDFYAEAGLSFDPFTAQEYSGVGAFDVLAKIVEVLSGNNYNDYLKENIFEPLGMTDTTFTPSNEQWDRIITMYNKEDGRGVVGKVIDGCVFENNPPTHFLGGAGLISSLSDYSIFAEMLRGRGSLGDVQILKPETVELISTPKVPESIMPGNERWGLGVRVITSEEYKLLPVGTFGWSGAYGTHFWVDPVNDITAVYMKNSRYDGGSGARTSKRFEAAVFRSLCV